MCFLTATKQSPETVPKTAFLDLVPFSEYLGDHLRIAAAVNHTHDQEWFLGRCVRD
jgi:hypothetical protein